MCKKINHVRFPVDQKSYPRPLFIRGRWFRRRSFLYVFCVTSDEKKQVLFSILGVYIEVGGGEKGVPVDPPNWGKNPPPGYTTPKTGQTL
jgi:hypothetical protein